MSSPFVEWPPTRETPASRAVMLTSAMLSDVADLSSAAKAVRVWNSGTTAVTLRVTPLDATDATAAGTVALTVAPGATSWEPISIRRVWSTGSTNLAAGLAAGTVEVVLATQ